MSSLIRRIERQVYASQPVHWNKKTERFEPAGARQKFYGGRGSKLGVSNPKCKALIARQARDKKWARKS